MRSCPGGLLLLVHCLYTVPAYHVTTALKFSLLCRSSTVFYKKLFGAVWGWMACGTFKTTPSFKPLTGTLLPSAKCPCLGGRQARRRCRQLFTQRRQAPSPGVSAAGGE